MRERETPKKPRESKDLTRGDLIFYVAKLRGALFGLDVGKREKDEILRSTSFDISDDDDAGYEAGKTRYFSED